MKGKVVMAMMLLGCFPLASAQVYKCKGASGETVYSQNPCAAGAEPMKLRSSRSSTETAGEASNRAAVYQNTELADAGIAERNCVQGERSRIYGPLESRSQQIGRQIAELNRQMAAPSNNLAGATRDSGIRTQIASLQQSLSAERMAADTQMASARERCASTRRERERSVRDKFSNVPAGTP